MDRKDRGAPAAGDVGAGMPGRVGVPSDVGHHARLGDAVRNTNATVVRFQKVLVGAAIEQGQDVPVVAVDGEHVLVQSLAARYVTVPADANDRSGLDPG